MDDTVSHPQSVREVVENGLCIGCGLCEALAPDRWSMGMTAQGRLRPAPIAAELEAEDQPILAACPGCVSNATAEGDLEDPMWGKYIHIGEAWAGDDDIRFRAATGGVLTALAVHLLRSKKAGFILHCAADTENPMRTKWEISETAEQILQRAGSRYGPSDTLAGLEKALERGQAFAIIAKPCDAGAVSQRAKADPRLDALLVAVLVMVCGGASELGKSEDLLEEFGVTEDELTLFRYRGYGNPGPTRVETEDGRAFEKTYQEFWADESGWKIQSRCKLCPDAIGEAADVAALDIWPGGTPVGEDEGFNGIITRSKVGQDLVQAAVAAGDLVLGQDHDPRQLDDFQPHQVSKKHAVAARLRGLSKAGQPTYRHEGLRLESLDVRDEAEERGAFERAKAGRFKEEMPIHPRGDSNG
ncbi:coenzyme F420-reducing hydrogenase subunit beta [Roseovarius albus]|uniref:Coenzyme F420-reducing hydrogenase subunit beta n=1 Tax=Roseovarius albus TaxID=1247867 RepID=A0A1X7A1E5_9RHOB|nr:Coenzyme F420 hydrogenase/dehydrogenase, beta subunit C-terminal domain [Roseovarius albus]SLN67318.1 coenzyme F420-reducing hydrogenase subunit beta [Roseovarius albus]